MAAYDHNFCYPIKDLECATVKLTPFVPAKHAQAFFDGTCNHPEIWANTPWEPFASVEEFIDKAINQIIQPDPGMVLFAVLDKTDPNTASPPLAGMIGLLSTSPANLTTEVGYMVMLPKFQRKGIVTLAANLLVKWCLDLPSQGGLGMRRVKGQTAETNLQSARLMHYVGWRYEGLTRWERVMPEGKGGPRRVREDGRLESPGRHAKVFSICWDDWENGMKARIEDMLSKGTTRVTSQETRDEYQIRAHL